MQTIYRQGDVLFIQVAELPKDAKPQKSNVLVEGETTGHAHRLTGADARVMVTTELMFIAAQSEAAIVHEEHTTIILPPAIYEVRRQREYVAPEISRMVID